MKTKQREPKKSADKVVDGEFFRSLRPLASVCLPPCENVYLPLQLCSGGACNDNNNTVAHTFPLSVARALFYVGFFFFARLLHVAQKLAPFILFFFLTSAELNDIPRH